MIIDYLTGITFNDIGFLILMSAFTIILSMIVSKAMPQSQPVGYATSQSSCANGWLHNPNTNRCDKI